MNTEMNERTDGRERSRCERNEWIRRNKRLIYAICVVIFVKIVLLSISVLGWMVLKNQIADITSIWNRWDAPHYIDIAKYGYTNEGERRYFIVFLPLYPIFIKLLSFICGYECAAMLVSNISSVAAAIYLFKLAKIDLSEEASFRCVVYFCTFPTAYFLVAGYTEGLFLLLAISCIYYARKKKWILAGISGMLATATRITALALLPAIIAEFLNQEQERKQERREKQEQEQKALRRDAKDAQRKAQRCKTDTQRAVFAILMTPLGFFAYLFINHITFGDAFAFMQIEREHWFKQLSPPWIGFLNAFFGVFWREPSEVALVCIAEIIFAFLSLACIIYAFIAKFRTSYCIYMLFSWLAFTSTHFWLSIPRYTLSLFPMFIVIASICERRDTLHHAIIIIFAMFLSFFTVLFTQGRWAF